MIPLRLMLSNFMSYKNPEDLDFSGIHVACLSGNNGHGKSALLDAMTWALWGWARGRRYGQGGNSADELVHQGQANMEVVLDFFADGIKYRILRKHSKGGHGRGSSTLLELQMDAGSEFRSISENTIIGTERRIQRILRMDYETFLDSAFLLQGQADRFTTSNPAQRKETLAGILGLSLYEKLEDEAKAKGREHQVFAQEQESTLEKLEQELEKKSGYLEAYKWNKSALGFLVPDLKEQRTALILQRNRLQHLETRYQEEQRLIAEQSRSMKELPILESQKASATKRVMDSRNLVNREKEIRDNFATLTSQKETLKDLETAKNQQGVLIQKKILLEHEVREQEIFLENQRLRLMERVEQDLFPKAENLSEIDLSLTNLSKDLNSLSVQETAIQSLRTEMIDEISETERVNLEADQSLAEMQNLRKQLDILSNDENQCPICGTSLDEKKLAHTKHELTMQGKANRKRYLNLQNRKKVLAKRRNHKESELTLKENKVSKEKRLLLARQGFLIREKEEATAAAGEVQRLTGELSRIESQLRLEDFARSSRSELNEVKDRISSLGYNSEKHQELETYTRSIDRYEREIEALERAKTKLPQEETEISSFGQIISDRKLLLIDSQESIASIRVELEGLQSVQEMVDRITDKLRTSEDEHSKVKSELIFYERRLDELKVTEKGKRLVITNLRKTRQQWRTYNLLANAFGKHGIQNLLIEEALPELESSANNLLARLTDNRLHLTLETQRYNRRGESYETLEIKIGDESGIRNFQLFSGGEAFRISFALRIALAKLLASRSGAPLKTLFLDEGFGTQDTNGRELLIDSIRAIQDEFDLILVITHIEELKDAFPVRIEVNKTDLSGSNFQLIWN